MEGHEDQHETQGGQEYTEWNDTSWDHFDKWTDTDGGRATGAQICQLILCRSKGQDNCHRHSQLKNSPIRHRVEPFRCSGGLLMCELSVNDVVE